MESYLPPPKQENGFSHIVLPGVGSYRHGAENLTTSGGNILSRPEIHCRYSVFTLVCNYCQPLVMKHVQKDRSR